MNHSPCCSAGVCASEVSVLGTKNAQNAPKRSQIGALIQGDSPVPCFEPGEGRARTVPADATLPHPAGTKQKARTCPGHCTGSKRPMITKICGVKKSSWLCPGAALSSQRASRHVADGRCVPGEATRTPKLGDLTTSVCLEMEDGSARGKLEGGRRGKLEKFHLRWLEARADRAGPLFGGHHVWR